MDSILRQKKGRAEAVEDLEAWREKPLKSMTPGAAAPTDDESERMVHEARAELDARRSNEWSSIQTRCSAGDVLILNPLRGISIVSPVDFVRQFPH
jgi:hypothetical protein